VGCCGDGGGVLLVAVVMVQLLGGQGGNVLPQDRAGSLGKHSLPSLEAVLDYLLRWCKLHIRMLAALRLNRPSRECSAGGRPPLHTAGSGGGEFIFSFMGGCELASVIMLHHCNVALVIMLHPH